MCDFKFILLKKEKKKKSQPVEAGICDMHNL